MEEKKGIENKIMLEYGQLLEKPISDQERK